MYRSRLLPYGESLPPLNRNTQSEFKTGYGHINDIYTQKYNRLKRTDGPLFRGRFGNVLVDGHAYLVPLTRYLHRNPIDMKSPLVAKLVDCLWSGYPAFVDLAEPQSCLEIDRTYGTQGHRSVIY